jgi:hypothetical protein
MCLKKMEIGRAGGASHRHANLKLACFYGLTGQTAKAKDLGQNKGLVESLRFGGGVLKKR